MRRATVILGTLLALLSTGCVSKQKLEEAQALLAACEDEKTGLEASVITWEQRFDRESERWQEMEASITTALPKALSDFHQERDRIVELMPEQVKAEVTNYLDDYFTTVMGGFERLKTDNDQIKMQLKATNKALESVGADTRSIGIAIDEALADERSKREGEQSRRDQVTGQLAAIVSQVVQFDRTVIDCKDCGERLKLNRNQRETLLAFHSELMNDLSSVQTFAGQAFVTESEEDTAVREADSN